jgi:hypothetical protein
MRDKKRIKRIVKKLEQLWNIYPDQRLGQLLENYIYEHHLARDKCMFHVPDYESESAIDIAIKTAGINLGKDYDEVQRNIHRKEEGFK